MSADFLEPLSYSKWLKDGPTIRQLRPHILEVGIPHILNRKDEAVGVFGDAFLDVGVEADRQFFAFFLGLGGVYDLGAL